MGDAKFEAMLRPVGECLEFIGYRDRQGYGHLGRKGRSNTLAHRYAFELANGPIPEGVVIRHACDNPPCCRPEHLLSGTQADNIRDRQVRGRHRPGRFPGEAHHNARLTDADVLEIRRLRAEGARVKDLAVRYGVHPAWLSRIARGAAWKHLVTA